MFIWHFLGHWGYSDEQRLQEAPAEAFAPVPAPAAVPPTATAPVPAEAMAPVPAPVAVSVEDPVLSPAEAPAPVEAPAEALAQAEAPAPYPSERLIQSTSEENQIPSHLPVCPSLQHIASLQGSAIVELFHSSIAEVLAQVLVLVAGTCVERGMASAMVPVSPVGRAKFVWGHPQVPDFSQD